MILIAIVFMHVTQLSINLHTLLCSGKDMNHRGSLWD